MITPEYLKDGDRIALTAPARYVERETLLEAINFFENQGFEVVIPDNLYKKQNQFSGSDLERTEDFQELLDNSDIKAIVCVRGGYGSVRVLQKLDFKSFANTPKWIVGFSDATVFHSYINSKLKVKTLHAPMPFKFGNADTDLQSFQFLVDCLKGHTCNYSFSAHHLNSEGRAKGKLVGGNLSVIYSLRGTPADIDTQGKILFLEDLDEYLYHIDRMMINLKYGGKLSSLRGIIVGSMNDMHDNTIPFGKNAYEIIADITADLNIPVCFGFPAGHEKINWPLVFGSDVILDVSNECKLNYIS